MREVKTEEVNRGKHNQPEMALSANPITVNVNKQNPQVKIHRVAQIGRVRPATGCLQETNFRKRETHTLKVKVWEKISRKWKQAACVALFLTDRKVKPSVRKDKQEPFDDGRSQHECSVHKKPNLTWKQKT